MKRLWVSVAMAVGVVGVMLGSASAGMQPPQIEKKFPHLERPAMVVRLQVTPPTRANVGQAVTMKVTVENPPILIQGTSVVYQFEWWRHASGNPHGNSTYRQATSWTWRPDHWGSYKLLVRWAYADQNGNVTRQGGVVEYDGNPLQVCPPAQPNC